MSVCAKSDINANTTQILQIYAKIRHYTNTIQIL